VSTQYQNPFESEPPKDQALHPSEGALADFVRDLRPILFQPRRFFSDLSESFTVGRALTYGVLAHWFGAATQLILKNIGYGSQNQLDLMLEKLLHTQATEWEAIRVAADPLSEIFKILSLALGIFISSKLLIGEKSVRFKDSIPFVGELVSNFWSFIVLLTGIQSFYKITSTRSLFIIFFPQLVTTLLLIAVVLLVAGAALLPLIQLFTR